VIILIPLPNHCIVTSFRTALCDSIKKPKNSEKWLSYCWNWEGAALSFQNSGDESGEKAAGEVPSYYDSSLICDSAVIKICWDEKHQWHFSSGAKVPTTLSEQSDSEKVVAPAFTSLLRHGDSNNVVYILLLFLLIKFLK